MHKYKKLFILVEGRSDQAFFDKIIKLGFERRYSRVHIRQYSEMRNSEVISLIDDIKAANNDCICVADINSAPCISERKQGKQKKEFRDVDKEEIMIVIKEIEGWYLAGLDEDGCKRLGVVSAEDTEKVTKADFDNIWRKNERFGSRVDLMQEILKSFDIETAKRKNESFRYFAEKYGL